jgi:hypothetical protein
MAPDVMTDEAWALWDASIAWLNPAPAPTPTMVAHWPMDEGAGTVVADVVGGNDGTMVGLDPNTAWIADGGVAFDNVDGHHIEVPHADAIEFGDESLTISLMVRYTNPPQGDADLWVMKGTSFYPAGTGCRYQLFQTGGPEVRFTLDDNVTKTDLKVPNDAFLTGEWVHVVAIRDAANDLLSVYADGILLGTQTDNTGDISNGEPLLIGEFPDGADSAMSGDIKDVRIFNSALTEDQIAAIYPTIVWAYDSCRTKMIKPDENDSANRLVVRTTEGDPGRSYKCWIKFDISGIDVQGLTSATLVTTLWKDRGACEHDVSYVHDDVVDNINWTTDDLTWNNAPGNDPASEGALDPAKTTLLGRPALSDEEGVAGAQFTVDALEALQTDTDGIVQFVLHNASTYTQIAHHYDDIEEHRPFLILE